MSPDLALILIAAAFLAAPIIFYLTLKGLSIMAISTADQAVIGELQTTNAALQNKLAAAAQAQADAVAAANAEAAQNAAETTAAYQAEADSLKTTVGA